MQTIFDWFSFAGQEAALFIVSMIPLIELRGSVILGAALGMPWQKVFVICVLGNLLPIPFVILCIKRIFYLLRRFPFFTRFVNWYEARLTKSAKEMAGYSFVGLALFVALPIPGTGAWSGAGVAALLNMRLRYAFPAIAAGVVICGIIMTISSYGLLNIARFFF